MCFVQLEQRHGRKIKNRSFQSKQFQRATKPKKQQPRAAATKENSDGHTIDRTATLIPTGSQLARTPLNGTPVGGAAAAATSSLDEFMLTAAFETDESLVRELAAASGAHYVPSPRAAAVASPVRQATATNSRSPTSGTAPATR